MATTAFTPPYCVLLVEDDPSYATCLREMIHVGKLSKFKVAGHSTTLADAIRAVENDPVDIVLLDLGLPDSEGLATFTKLHAVAPHVPIIVLTGTDDEELALEAVHLGAQEYLVKSAHR